MAVSTPKVLALFEEVDGAAEALRRLYAAGVNEDDVHVLSGVPFPDETFKARPARVFLQWITLAGGFLGALAGIALAGGTALFYKIPTGHMNIVAPPPVGIITYEVTMLGAIVFTIVGLIAMLRKGRPQVDEPRLAEGYIGVLVPATRERQKAAVEAIFQESGAAEIRHLPEQRNEQ